MQLRHYDAVRFEDVLPEGRTQPLVLACRLAGESGPTTPKVVKAIGCPEVTATHQLVAEVVGNATARRMSVQTPEPCIVHLDPSVARITNLSLQERGYAHNVQFGPAAGCDLVRPAPVPFTIGQNLTPELRLHAVRLYVFDLLSQNPDRRKNKVNCALTGSGLLSFDFEMCFAHLFLSIIGGLSGDPWEPSKDMQVRNHLFYEVARSEPPDLDAISQAVDSLSGSWWRVLSDSLPAPWRAEADKIGVSLALIADHAEDFGRDVLRSLY